MVKPDKMFKTKKLVDFVKLNYDDIIIYIENEYIKTKNVLFLIPYLDKYEMSINGNEITIKRFIK
jgi:hypothetical protein